jgi:nitrogen fixation protein NifQ
MKGFTDTIRRYAADNRYSGGLSDADGVGEIGLGAKQAGRQIAVRFALRLREGCIADLRYQVFGCGYSMAACAAAAELAVGATLDQVQSIDAQAVDSQLAGLPAERRYCADLAAEALQAALISARSRTERVQAVYALPNDNHGPRLDGNNPLYRSLMDSPAPADIPREDRHLFACLLTVACQEAYDTAAALGLNGEELSALQRHYFPSWDASSAARWFTPAAEPFPEINADVRQLLLAHAPKEQGLHSSARWLARILAARAALPGHLWVAMGLFERPQLSAAIQRHLPSVFAANTRNMRWKRFFFKQVCELNGGTLCKTPNCGECSDYALCFALEE